MASSEARDKTARQQFGTAREGKFCQGRQHYVGRGAGGSDQFVA